MPLCSAGNPNPCQGLAHVDLSIPVHAVAAQMTGRFRCRYSNEGCHLLQVGPVEVLLGRANGSAFATPLTAPGQVPWVKHPHTSAWLGAVVAPVSALAVFAVLHVDSNTAFYSPSYWRRCDTTSTGLQLLQSLQLLTTFL
jgi:hypothetical protein